MSPALKLFIYLFIYVFFSCVLNYFFILILLVSHFFQGGGKPEPALAAAPEPGQRGPSPHGDCADATWRENKYRQQILFPPVPPRAQSWEVRGYCGA